MKVSIEAQLKTIVDRLNSIEGEKQNAKTEGDPAKKNKNSKGKKARKRKLIYALLKLLKPLMLLSNPAPIILDSQCSAVCAFTYLFSSRIFPNCSPFTTLASNLQAHFKWTPEATTFCF
jgi:hypothetical protein